MKKLVVATALIGCSLAYAEVDISGEGRVRHTVKRRSDFVSSSSASTAERFRLNFTGKKSENSKFSVFTQLQFTDTQGTTASGTLANPGANVHQAYVNYRGNDYFNLTAGRFEVNFGDQLVVGGVGWHDEARAFDGVTIGSKCLISGTNTFFALKADEQSNSADTDVYGIYHAQSIGDIVKNFDLYWINASKKVTGGATDQNTFGLRLKSKMGDFDYRFEATAQNGKVSGSKVQGNQIDLELGYALPFIGSRLSVEYFKASKNYAQLYPTAHKWLGFADMFMRKNINGIVIHYSAKPMDKLVAKVDYHMFSRTDTGVTAYTFGGGAYGTTGTDEAIGSEIDLTLKYTLDEGLTTQAGYSIVTTGDYLKAQGLENNMNYSYLQIAAKF